MSLDCLTSLEQLQSLRRTYITAEIVQLTHTINPNRKSQHETQLSAENRLIKWDVYTNVFCSCFWHESQIQFNFKELNITFWAAFPISNTTTNKIGHFHNFNINLHQDLRKCADSTMKCHGYISRQRPRGLLCLTAKICRPMSSNIVSFY